MKFRAAILSFVLLTLAYAATVLLLDTRHHSLSDLQDTWRFLPLLMLASACSYLLRYLRWRWLLRRCACSMSMGRGFLAYLAGFAFTVSPGKVGELVRIRYFSTSGVAAGHVIGAFIFERCCDLIVLLILSSLYPGAAELLPVAVVFVAIILMGTAALASKPAILQAIDTRLQASAWFRLSTAIRSLSLGIQDLRTWCRLPDIALGLGLGLIAWGGVAAAFVAFLNQLAISRHGLDALSYYPLAMLVGAASLLPGGLGSTEAILILLLESMGYPLGAATAVAVTIRIATLWFAMLCGLLSIAILESRYSTLAE